MQIHFSAPFPQSVGKPEPAHRQGSIKQSRSLVFHPGASQHMKETTQLEYPNLGKKSWGVYCCLRIHVYISCIETLLLFEHWALLSSVLLPKHDLRNPGIFSLPTEEEQQSACQVQISMASKAFEWLCSCYIASCLNLRMLKVWFTLYMSWLGSHSGSD